jgi:adenine-specific DNA-methyltransferase
MQNLYKDLIQELAKNEKFLLQGQVSASLVRDKAYKLDPELVALLFGNERLKQEFFTETNGAMIFNYPKFAKFITNKEFLPDSYTEFESNIGLSVGDKFLSENKEVVLSFPFKDCILEGGMDTEEAKNRKEIFYNQTLAPDDIHKLKSPKALKSFEKHTVKGKEEVRELKLNDDGTFNENFIIKGNNLLALYSLLPRYKDKVKLIYIDPPYYFKDDKPEDTFRYNSNFKLSSWLVFMKNRLEVARQLLSEDGTIFVQIKDDGMAHLKILMDEIFGDNFVNCIAVKMSEASGVKMAHSMLRFPNIKEYILFYRKSKEFKGFYKIDKYKNSDWDKENNIFLENFSLENRGELLKLEDKDDLDDLDIESAIKILSNAKKVSLSEKLKSLDDNIDKTEWLFENSYRIIKTAGSSSLAKQVSSLKNIPSQDFSASKSNDGLLFYYITDFNKNTDSPRLQVLFADVAIWKNPCDFWQDIKTTGAIAKEGGVSLNGGKKPERLLQRIVDMTTQEGDIVLDFFGGSGTTGAVAHKMKRRYILTEQMDYIKDLPEKRLKNVINGDQTGISKAVNWQGGGSFIYLELAKNNITYLQKIEELENRDPSWSLFEELNDSIWISYRVDIDKFKEHKDQFLALELEDQKKILKDVINYNHLYVNYEDMEDIAYKDCGLSTEDKVLTTEFYEKKPTDQNELL